MTKSFDEPSKRTQELLDAEFLRWLVDRLVNVYGESPNIDFVHKLRSIADRLEND